MPSDRRLYVGPSLRRLRRDRGLTQSDMAADLEVSPSYIALLERNHRPLSAEMLLRLAQTYTIDLSSLAGDSAAEERIRLQAALKDPIFADIDLPALETADVVTNFPSVVEAFLRLYTTYREEQLALADRGVEGGGEGGNEAGDPVAEARRFLAARRNSFPLLDDTAERLARSVAEHDSLTAWFKARLGLQVKRVPPEFMVGSTRRLDRHGKQILLDAELDNASQNFQLAQQLAYLEMSREIETVLKEGAFASENGERLTRRALAGYAAAAILMPYGAFFRAVESRRYDLEALSRQFGASFEQVAHRLTTLQKPARKACRSSSSASMRPATSPSASMAPGSPSPAMAAAARYGTCTSRSAPRARSSPSGWSCPTARDFSPSLVRSPPAAAASAVLAWSALSASAAPPSTRIG